MKSKMTLKREFRLIYLSFYCFLRSLKAILTNCFRKGKRVSSGQPDSFVIYSIIPWDGVWQRPQHFATRLSEHYSVLYVDPTGVQHIAAAQKSPPPPLSTIHDKLLIWRPRLLPGGKTHPYITYLNDEIILDEIRSLIRKIGFKSPGFITNTPLADKIANRGNWSTITYDVIDDFVRASWAPKDAIKREQTLFALAENVFTGTFSLYRKKSPFHSNITYIPCGVEIDHFMKANDSHIKLPPDIKNISRPIIGYFGALNERLDTDLIVKIASQRPKISIVLIGPIFADFGLSDFKDKWASVLTSPATEGFRLKEIPPNIHILGIKSYDQLPAYLKAFDACLLPYVINPVTRDIHPVKILEYLAAGRPVVSTALPDMKRFYTDVVSIADDHMDFISKIDQALENNRPEDQKSRIEFARPKTWENMSQTMLEKITERNS